MPFDSKIMSVAKQRLEGQRRRRQSELNRRQTELNIKMPRLAEIEASLRLTIAQVAAAALRTGEDPLPAIMAAKAENLSLQEERIRVLVMSGYGADYLDDSPQCKLCEDTGYVKGKPCACLLRLCGEEQIRELSTLLRPDEQNFDSFDFNLYSSIARKPGELSPRECMERIYDFCLNYAVHFEKGSGNLLFSGGTGLGKTFLSCCIAIEVSGRGYSVIYDTIVTILASFEGQKFSSGDAESDFNVKRYLGCELLVIDDLGTELTTQFSQSAFYTLLNTRLMSGRSTIISTNLPMSGMKDRYTQQIISRIEGEYQPLYFVGDDIRLKKRNGK